MTALFAVLIWVGACASLLGFFTYAASRWYINIYILLVRADQIGAQPPLRTLLRSMHFLWIGASGFVGCLSIYCVLKFWPIALFVELPAAVLFLLIAGLGAWLTRAALHHQHLRKVIRAIDYLLVVSVCLGLLGAIAALLLTSMEIASPRQAASPIHAILQISTPVAVVFSALSAGLGLYAYVSLISLLRKRAMAFPNSSASQNRQSLSRNNQHVVGSRAFASIPNPPTPTTLLWYDQPLHHTPHLHKQPISKHYTASVSQSNTSEVKRQ